MTNERPIIFQGWCVRAILDGIKTQTRRVVKHQRPGWRFHDLKTDLGYPASLGHLWAGFYLRQDSGSPGYFKSPYGLPGDLLWVRETHAFMWPSNCDDGFVYDDQHPEGRPVMPQECTVEYRADTGNRYPGEWPDDCGGDPACPRWLPSIHMPKWACRLWLRVTGIRVEPVQEISGSDAKAEGVDISDDLFPTINTEDKLKARFQALWDGINRKRGYGWDVNPWTWVIEFERITPHVIPILREDWK